MLMPPLASSSGSDSNRMKNLEDIKLINPQ
jgi:hypothetical protein